MDIIMITYEGMLAGAVAWTGMRMGWHGMGERQAGMLYERTPELGHGKKLIVQNRQQSSWIRIFKKMKRYL